MVNLITGLKYQPPYQEIKTEEQLFEVFADLRKDYEEIRTNFTITYESGEPIQNFEQFLKLATGVEPHIILMSDYKKLNIILKGSGNIGGLEVKDASLEYGLGLVFELVQHWDIHRDEERRDCHSCTKSYFYASERSNWRCSVGGSMWTKNCLKYDAKIKNAEGGPARKLDEMVAEALSSSLDEELIAEA